MRLSFIKIQLIFRIFFALNSRTFSKTAFIHVKPFQYSMAASNFSDVLFLPLTGFLKRMGKENRMRRHIVCWQFLSSNFFYFFFFFEKGR